MLRIKGYFKWIMAIVVVMILSVQAQARGYYESGDVQVDIVSDQRGLLPAFTGGSRRANTERRYIIGRDNEQYRIRISNQTNERIGVLVAVDGRNIISGNRSSLQSNERMYILAPYQTQEYDGWGKGRQQRDRFFFAGRNEYTSMGVAKVAVFRDRRQNSHKKNHGQGWRGKRFDQERHFAAQKRPIEKKIIQYEHRSTLCRMGLVQCRPRHERKHFRPQRSRNNDYSLFPSWHLFLKF